MTLPPSSSGGPAPTAPTGNLRDLEPFALRSGACLTRRCLEPPAPEYTERLQVFLDHKPDVIGRKLRRQLSGAYRGECVDRFFLGEVNGQLAGQLWYGYAREGAGTANFGEVYTAPEHRRQGIAEALTASFAADFDAGPARLALCTAGPDATRIYARHGFQPVIPGANRGPLIRLKPAFGASFAEYAEAYYQPGQPVTVLPGSMRHRHDIDCLLRFTHILGGGADLEARLRRVGWPGASLAERIGPAWQVANYMEACFQAEDGRGLLTVAGLPGGRVAGWAFVLRREAPLEADNAVFDFELHPAYAEAAPLLVRETLRLAAGRGIHRLVAWCAGSQTQKLAALVDNGLVESARLAGYCHLGSGETVDALILRPRS